MMRRFQWLRYSHVLHYSLLVLLHSQLHGSQLLNLALELLILLQQPPIILCSLNSFSQQCLLLVLVVVSRIELGLLVHEHLLLLQQLHLGLLQCLLKLFNLLLLLSNEVLWSLSNIILSLLAGLVLHRSGQLCNWHRNLRKYNSRGSSSHQLQLWLGTGHRGIHEGSQLNSDARG